MAEPVAQTVGVTLVDLADGHVDIKALVDLLLRDMGREDDSYGKDVVDLLKRHMLGLHLVPDGVGALHTCQDLVVHTHLIQRLADGLGELLEESLALLFREFQLLLDQRIFLGMLKAETEVL